MAKGCVYNYNNEEHDYDTMRSIVENNPDDFIGGGLDPTSNNFVESVLTKFVDTREQNRVLQEIDRLNASITKNSDGYMINSVQFRRVTEIVNDKVYKKTFPQERELNEKDLILRLKGTILHSYNEEIMKELDRGTKAGDINYDTIRTRVISETKSTIERELNDYNPSLAYLANDENFYRVEKIQQVKDITTGERSPSDKYFGTLVRGINDLYQKINDPKITSRRGEPKLLFEQAIADTDRQVAGTIDLMAVYGDGTVAIYDYKFIDAQFKFNEASKKDKRLKKYISEKSEIPQYKYDAYNTQLNEYRSILQRGYNVSGFREMRIVPIGQGVNYISNDPEGAFKGVKAIEFLSSHPLFQQIPSNMEITEYEDMNKFIQDLRIELTRLEKEFSMDRKNEALKLQVQSIRGLITDILVNKDLASTVARARNLLITLENQLNIQDSDNPAYLSFDQINEAFDMLKTFETLSGASRKMVKDIKDDTIIDELRDLSGEIVDMQSRIQDEYVHRLQTMIDEKGINLRIDDVQKEQGMIAMMKNMSDIDHPAIVLFRRLALDANTATKNNTEALAKELQEQKTNLQDAAKRRGVSLNELLQLMINEDTGGLVAKLNADFYAQRDEQNKAGNIKWFKDNYEIRDTWKDNFNKFREKHLEDLKSKYDEKTQGDKIDFYIKKFDKNYDLENNDEAWLNVNNQRYNLQLKNEEQHYSDRYNTIRDIPELLEFYDYHKKKVIEFEKLVNREVSPNFIPQIKASMVDRLVNTNKSFPDAIMNMPKDMWNDFHESIKVHEHYDDETTGALLDKKIPVFFVRPLDANIRSRDLLANLLIFGQMAYNHDAMSNIEGAVVATRNYLQTQSPAQTNSQGKEIYDTITREIKKKAGLDGNMNLRLFDMYMNDILYGQSLQSKDYTFEVKGNKYSFNKLATAVIKYMSVRTLSFNWRSGIPGAIAAYTNAYFGGKKGLYYTDKMMKKTHSLLAKRGSKDKYYKLVEYFNIERGAWTQEEANKLKGSQISKHINYENMFLLQKKPDEFIANTVMVSMLQNYGIDENGRVKRLQLLPEGTKSLFELANTDGDTIKIEGLTEEAFTQFRRISAQVISRMKGSVAGEDPTAIRYYVIGRAFTHFRSWIAPMVAERFGNTNYNQEVEEFEAGRYRVFVGELMNQTQGAGKNLLKFAADFTLGFTGINRITGRQSMALNGDAMWDAFKKANIDEDTGKTTNNILRAIQRGEITEAEAKEKYIQTRIGQYKAALAEFRMLTMALGAHVLALSDWDEDDETLAEEIFGNHARIMMIMLQRINAELTFFMSPGSFQEIIRSPLPALGLINDFVNIPKNTFDEFVDFSFGKRKDPDDWTSGEWDKFDQAEKFHYTGRAFPIVKPVWDYVDNILDDEE